MEDTFLIKILANAQQALDEIKEVNQKLGKTTEEAEKAKKSLTMTDVWAAFTMAKGVVMGVVGALSEFVGSANNARMAMMGLNEVSKAYGQDSQKANQYAKELTNDGLMQLTSSAQTLKFLMSSGFNISEAMDIARSMKDIGAFNNTIGNLDQAMADAAKGIKTGSIELIENIGLTQKLSAVMDDAGVSTAAGIDITNNAAQRQALYNAIIAEGNKFQGNAAKLAGDSVGIYSQLGNAYDQLKVKIGETLNVAFVPLAEILTKVVTFLREHFAVAAGIATGAIAGMVAPAIALAGAISGIGAAVTAATGGMNLLIAAAVALGVTTIAYSAAIDQSTESVKQNTTAVTDNKNAKIEAEQDLITRIKATQFEYMTAEEKKVETARQSLYKIQALQDEYHAKSTQTNYAAQQAEIAELNRLETVAAQNLENALNEKNNKHKKANDKTVNLAKEMHDRLIELEKQFANRKYDIESHAEGVKKRADAKELKRMQSYGMEQVDLGEKIAKTKIKGDEQATESGLKQTQSALSSMQSIFAAQSNQSRAMFNINKGLSLTQATIATYEGATNAYASGAKIDPTGVWPAVYAGIVTAAGLANIATIATQEFEPVEDFISIPGKPLLKARPDDIVIGGTNLLGNGAGNDPLLKAMLLNNKILKEKSMQAILNLGDKLVYMQNLKGQKAVNQGRL